jgi:hypothetical protein
MVMDYLEARGGSATRVSILQKFQGDIDHVDLNHIAAYLEESNFMNVERHGTGQVFQMPKKVLEKYKAWKESRKKQDSGDLIK